jgi:4-amino-4-deoxy-L-arabinose transferase-like glycosyltransferase
VRLRHRWGGMPHAAEGLALALVLAAAGVLFVRGLDFAPSFDEGVYLGQTDALEHGQRLGTDVFAAQPPGFHWLLLGAARIGGLDLDRLRLAIVAIALLGLVAAYAVARTLAGPTAGVAAAAVLAVAPAYQSFSARISADLPGTVLALLALACLLGEAPSRGRVVAGGLLVAASEWVKLDAFVVLLPVAILLARRRLRPADAGVAASIAVLASGVAAGVLGGALPAVWHGAVSYHVAARSVSGAGTGNVHALVAFFTLRQPFTWIVAAAAAAALALRARERLALWPFWAAAAAAAGFLLWHRPLHDNHMVLLAVALAPVVGVSLAASLTYGGTWTRNAVGAALVVLLAGGYVQETRAAKRDAGPIPAELTWAADRVAAAVPAGQLVLSDEPLVPVLAHRQMPGQTIDTALLRFATGYLTDATVLRAIEENHVRAVVVDRAFLSRPQLLAALDGKFPLRRHDGTLTVYLR